MRATAGRARETGNDVVKKGYGENTVVEYCFPIIIIILVLLENFYLSII